MTAPTLAARPADCRCCVLVHCDHCQRDHRHGAQPGHRVAHCRDPDSPYRTTGYVLVLRPTDKGGSNVTHARPIRHAGSWTATDTGDAQPDPLDVAHAEVAEARAIVEGIRRRVSVGQDGAASLGAAEFRLARALDRLAELNGTPPPSFPSAEPMDAA